ncbi:MAG: HNH endonuclease [Chloroflexi bacterium]|nr:HNH endonuclease [Chloroflexota bacterium]
MTFHLSIELVPRPLWGKSLKQLLPRERWDTLRRQVYRTHRYRCQGCGATDITMYCHEVWRYDDEAHVQHLVDLVALCFLCHECIHLGHASVLAAAGKLDLEAVAAHFCRVNGYSRDDYAALREAAFELWANRSQREWTQDFGRWADLVAATETPGPSGPPGAAPPRRRG